MATKTNYKLILILLIIIAFFIRLPGLNHFAAMDEKGWLSSEFWLNWHPPLSILMHTLFRFILGSNVWVSKLLMLLVGLVNICLVYFVSKDLFSEKAAIFAAGLMTFGAYPTLASLQIDIDGSFLMMFYLLSTWMFLKYEKTKERKWLVLTGIGSGLAMLTKFPGVFIFGILGLYYLLKTKNIVKTFKVFVPVILVGLVVFSIYPLTVLASGSSMLADNLRHFSRYTSPGEFNLGLLLVQYMLSVIWLGPLFIVLFLISVKKWNKKYLLPIVWISLIFVFYTFVNTDNFKPIERYFTVLLAPLSMIVGNFLSKAKIKISKTLIVSFIASLVLIFIFSQSADFINFYPKTAFVSRAMSLDWNFYLPITGSSGPIGFFLDFQVVGFSFLVSMLLLGAYLGLKNKKTSAVILAVIIGVGFGYNVFVMQEFLFSTTSPSVNKISYEVLDYIKDNEYDEVKVFRNTAFQYYLPHLNVTILDFEDEFSEEEIIGDFAIIDFPTINKESILWEKLSRCQKVGFFEDKGVVLGYLFYC